MKIMVLVHPQLGLLCGAALPGAFFSSEKHDCLLEKHYFSYFLNEFPKK